MTAIWMLATGAIVGALLGVLCKRSLLYGLFWGLIFNVIGWAIILLDDDVAKNSHESEKRKKWIKIARIIVGSVLTVISLSGLVCALMSSIPAWDNARRIIFTFIALVAMIILGIVVLWKGIRKPNSSNLKEKIDPIAPVIKCTNRSCGKEISSNFDKCPFCGTQINKPIIEANEEK